MQRVLRTRRDPAPRHQGDPGEAILDLVGAGQGVAVLASWSIAPAVAAGTVRARP
jgi:DNA-binding transcriptional LysR family regulator